MATPDLTPYVDLTFFDKDPQDIFDAALQQLKVTLPDWEPREGNVEVLLLEAMALQVAEAIFAVNRLPGAVVQALLRLYGVNPDDGTQPTVTLEFTASDNLGHDIPAGTGALLELSGGLEPVVFTTDEALAIPPGSTTGTVTATGDRFTNEANGTPVATLLNLIDSIVFVESVATTTAVGGGEDPETDQEWIERGVQRFARLSDALVLPKHFEAFALEDPAVSRAKAFDNWNGSAGAPGDHPGYVAVAVYGNGAQVPLADRNELDVAMEDAALANLEVVVINPTITAVDVTVSVKRKTGYTNTQVQANVTAALQAYLNTSTWSWSTTVRRFELISVIDQAEGVDYVDTLTAPAADVTLSGTATLASAGTISVTTS